MPIVLIRVDQRLIHGQVVHGWGNHLRPDRYVVVDEELAHSDWEQDLYRLGAGDVDAWFEGIESARAALQQWRDDEERTVILARDLDTVVALAKDGALAGEKVNLGGIHHGPGRTEVLPYLHLSEEDRGSLTALEAEGVEVSARDLPDRTPVALSGLLRR